MKRRRVLESAGAAILTSGTVTATNNSSIGIFDSGPGIGIASHSSPIRIEYGETKTGTLTEAHDGSFAEMFITSTDARDSVSISAQLDNESIPLIGVIDMEAKKWVSDKYVHSENISLSVPSTDRLVFVLLANGVDYNTVSYEFSVESGSSGDENGDNIDLRSISYGQTKSSHVDSDDPIAYGSYHYEPITFSGDEGDQIKIEVTSDDFTPFTYLYTNNSLQERGRKSLKTTLESNGEHTIRVFALPQSETGSYTISLSTTSQSSNDNYRLQVHDTDLNPKRNVRVRLLNVPTGGFGPNNPGIVLPKPSAIELVSEATTGEDGYAVFDGADNPGQPLPVSDLDNIASEYDGRIVVAAWTPNASQPWFGTWRGSPSEIISKTWNGRGIKIENQMLFGPTTGGHTDGMAAIWRSLKPNKKRKQNIYMSLSGGKVGVGRNEALRMARLNSGIASFGVPEDVLVDRDGVSLWFAGSQSLEKYNRAPVVGSLILSDLYPSLPPYAALRNAAYKPYDGDKGNPARELRSDIIGNLPIVSDILGTGGDIIDLLDRSSDSQKVDHSFGSGTDISLNEYDLVSTSWTTRHYNFVYKVPVEFPDENPRTFAGRAKWFAEDSNDTEAKVELDVPLRFGSS